MMMMMVVVVAVAAVVMLMLMLILILILMAPPALAWRASTELKVEPPPTLASSSALAD